MQGVSAFPFHKSLSHAVSDENGDQHSLRKSQDINQSNNEEELYLRLHSAGVLR
jgi:hypothetical protein